MGNIIKLARSVELVALVSGPLLAAGASVSAEPAVDPFSRVSLFALQLWQETPAVEFRDGGRCNPGNVTQPDVVAAALSAVAAFRKSRLFIRWRCKRLTSKGTVRHSVSVWRTSEQFAQE